MPCSERKAELRAKESVVRSSDDKNNRGKWVITNLGVKELTKNLKEPQNKPK